MFASFYPAQEFHHLVNSIAMPHYNRTSAPYALPRRTAPRHIDGHPAYTTRYYVRLNNQEDGRPLHSVVEPRVSYSQDAEAYSLVLEVPGFAKQQISVEFVDHQTLQVCGDTRPTLEHDQVAPQVATAEAAEFSVTPATNESGSEQSRSEECSPGRRTSVEEVRDETEPGYVEIDTATASSTRSTPVPRSVDSESSQSIRSKHQAEAKLGDQPRATRSFEKSFELPKDVNREEVSAEMTDGILRIRFAKITPEVRKRRIAVL